MSLPTGDMQAAPATTAIRPRFTKWDWVRVGVLTLLLSAGYLVIDIALDPALLPHAARAGRLLVLLFLVSIGFFLSWGIIYELHAKRSRVERTFNVLFYLLAGPTFPIWSIVWLDPYQPNIRYASMMFTGFGLGAIGLTPFGLSLVYGLLMARGRYTSEDMYAGRGVPGREEVVGLGSLAWTATYIWLLATVAASIYGMWLALTNPLDNASLLMSFVILFSALVLAIGGIGWIWWHAGRYARQTGDAALLVSTTVPTAKRAMPARVVVPPDERPRWGISLLVGLGLVAVSLLTFAVLDWNLVQSSFSYGNPPLSTLILIPGLCWIGIFSASARHYQPARFRRLLAAAAAFVVAGNAMLIDVTHPSHAIVPPLGLLAFAVPCSTLSVLICRSLLLHPMVEVNTEPYAATPLDPAPVHETATTNDQIHPPIARHLVLLQPLLIVVAHLLFYGDAAIRGEWGAFALGSMAFSMTLTLLAVVRTDLPQK